MTDQIKIQLIPLIEVLPKNLIYRGIACANQQNKS